MFYSLVKKYTQNFNGIPLATVVLKVHIFNMKLKADVKMLNGNSFILESYRFEENYQFEKRIEIEIINKSNFH
jgi:hypothetical protein